MKDDVDRLTPLSVMVLALLREDDMHPYEMIRLMRFRHDDDIVPVTNGTFYHTVSRLERQGLVAEVGVDRCGNRPERTTYTLTDAGRQAVVDWVRRELPRIDRETEARVALAEAHNLERDEAASLLHERRAALTVALDELSHGLDKAETREVPPQFLIEAARRQTLLSAEISWLDSLLVHLAESAYAWGMSEERLQSETYLADRKAAAHA